MVDKKNNTIMIVLASALAVFTGLTAQLSFKIGIIPYTMQNLGVVLSGLLLGPYWGFISQMVYLILIAIGAPLASGFTGGMGVFFGPTAGYLLTFPIASALTGFFRRILWQDNLKGKILVWLGSIVSFLPVYLGGFLVFYRYATMNTKAMGFAVMAISQFGLELDPFWTVFVATTIIFMPQDFFVDHIIAISAYAYIRDLLHQKGLKIG
jgi:biotin transport system substrate-specific component